MPRTSLVPRHVILILSLLSSLYSSIQSINPSSPAWVGIEALQKKEYEKSLNALLADSVIVDSAFHYFKLGHVHEGLGNSSKALFFFRLCAKESNQYTPFAYEKIAEIELTSGRYESALKAYRAAVQKTEILPYRYLLYRKMYSIAVFHADSLGQIDWLEEIVDVEQPKLDTVEKEYFTSLPQELTKNQHDSTLIQFLDTSYHNDTQCVLCSKLLIDSIPTSLYSTKTLFLLSKLAYTCKLYGASSTWLHKALKRKNFNRTIPKKKYLYHRAMLNYRLKNHGNVIKWAKRYIKYFDPDPTLVYILARSYRSLGKGSKASYWYDRHIVLFPYHRKTRDIIWYRAWQREDANLLSQARAQYKKLFNGYKSWSKADDAYFRYALTYCKELKYKSGLQAFTSFLKRYPASHKCTGARYWQAKCHYSLNNFTKAQSLCHKLLVSAPTNYYAYRARELLFIMGDTVNTLTMDTLLMTKPTQDWLDSLTDSTNQTFSAQDSSLYWFGTCLAAVGMAHNAELVLEPFELTAVKNLPLQFELAKLYKRYNISTRSFKIARYLYNRIPAESKAQAPLGFYTVLFPDSYKEYIDKEAQNNDVPSELISAIIRQESIFDPLIESPVGAIGLMQIMPYTGEEIAEDLKQEFYLDSLYNPAYNIRFGSYYIKKLIKKFNGDFILAIAGYNGGPHNAKRWKAQNADDEFDMFIEDIGYTETRNYVKKVLGNFWTYKQLKQIGLYEKER